MPRGRSFARRGPTFLRGHRVPRWASHYKSAPRATAQQTAAQDTALAHRTRAAGAPMPALKGPPADDTRRQVGQVCIRAPRAAVLNPPRGVAVLARRITAPGGASFVGGSRDGARSNTVARAPRFSLHSTARGPSCTQASSSPATIGGSVPGEDVTPRRPPLWR